MPSTELSKRLRPQTSLSSSSETLYLSLLKSEPQSVLSILPFHRFTFLVTSSCVPTFSSSFSSPPIADTLSPHNFSSISDHHVTRHPPSKVYYPTPCPALYSTHIAKDTGYCLTSCFM